MVDQRSRKTVQKTEPKAGVQIALPPITKTGMFVLVLAGFVALLGIGNSAVAELEYGIRWTDQFGSTGNDLIYAATTDSAGNLVVAGWTTGSLEGTNAGMDDAFVRWYAPNGTVLRTDQFGAGSYDRIYAATTDSAGNLVVAGLTTSSLESPNAGGDDAFVRWYAPNDTVLRTDQFGTAGHDHILAVTTDSTGNLVVAGETKGALVGTNPGGYDSFVKWYAPNSTVIRTDQFGTAIFDEVLAATTDSAGNLVVAGRMGGAPDGANADRSDAFVRWYAPNGTSLRTEQFGALGYGSITTTTTDSAGNLVVAGSTIGTPDSASADRGDAFVRWYAPNGAVLRTDQFGTAGSDSIRAATTDSTGNLVVAGHTLGALGGINVGGEDAFVRWYAPNGAVLRTYQLGTGGNDIIRAATTNSAGNLVVAGLTTGSLEGRNAGGEDAFVRAYTLTAVGDPVTAPTTPGEQSLEARIAALEAKIGMIETDTATIYTEIDRIKHNIRAMLEIVRGLADSVLALISGGS